MNTLGKFARVAIITSGFLGVFAGNFSHASVWPTENQWSQDWEDRYAQWAKTDWDYDMFKREGTPYKDLKLDCADVLYSMRAIFSWENKLPFAMQDPTSWKKIVTNDISKFDRISDPSKRFRAFLVYMYGLASTKSVPNDTYPPAVTPETIRGGSVILADEDNHHSWTIKEIRPTGISHLVYSSRPARSLLLTRIYIPFIDFLFNGKLSVTTGAGIRNFRKREDLLKPVTKVQGFSEEQYKIPLASWRWTIQKKLATVDESPADFLRRSLNNACSSAQERIEAVSQGLAALEKLDANSCFGTDGWEDFSTPNRDIRLKGEVLEAKEAWAKVKKANVHLDPSFPSDLKKIAGEVFDAEIIKATPVESGFCALQVEGDKWISFATLMSRSAAGALSSEPTDPFAYRWGEKGARAHTGRTWKCMKEKKIRDDEQARREGRPPPGE